MTVKAIRMQKNGGPEVLELVDVELGEPGPGEVLIRQHAIGVNYLDIYFREGLYPQPMPSGIGQEGAGVIEKVGAGVTHVKVGDRVAYAGRPSGSYAQARIMPADIIVKLPDAISFEQGASMMLQGLTVSYLLNDTYKVKQGETVLFHAAAGGVGLIACQWLKAIGATMIGTVGSPEKAAIAKAHGCAHTILYREEDFAKKVREITGGKGVPVVYDSIGKDTFMGSLDSLSSRGLMVTFGNASGPVPPLDVGILAGKGSLKLTRPTLTTYVLNRELLEPMAADLFQRVISGQIKIEITKKYPLADAAQAQRDMTDRKTTGSVILLP
ncbi:MAG: quinone oxidoreductase [Betaproteobacteria bacterium]